MPIGRYYNHLTSVGTTGKPYQVALEEDIQEVISVFRYYAGYADKLHGQGSAPTSTHPTIGQ